MSTLEGNKFDNFGQALSKALILRGLSQSNLVDSMGGSSSQVSKWVSGMHVPYARTIYRMGKLLQVDFIQDGSKWQLIDRKEAPPSSLPSMPSQAGERSARAEDEPVPYGSTSKGAPAVARAREVDLGPDAKPTVEDIQALLEQIESLVRIARDTMKRL